MILHLVTDEKFTDYAIKQFYSVGNDSEFILIPSNGIMDCVTLIDKVKIINNGSQEYYNLINNLNRYKTIIFHGMHWGNWQTTILESVPKNIKVAWVFWGGDLYARSDFKYKKLGILTTLISNARNVIKRNKQNNEWEIPRLLFKRIDYCLTDELEEYLFAKNELVNEMQFHWYNYYSLEETLGDLISKKSIGRDIVIGNSATIECNYFDILLKVKTLNFKNRNIILPLSYGKPWIRNLVSKLGKIFFKDCISLCSFLKRNEYNSILLNCNIMIMAHYYPQAQGNIITGLWLGMKVYLSNKNMTYHYFKRIGCYVYSIENDLKRSNKELYEPETEEKIRHNRQILSYWYSKENMKKRNSELVNLLSM